MAHNEFLITPPTVRCNIYDFNGSATYDSIGGIGDISYRLDTEKTDIASAMNTMRVQFSNLSTNYIRVNFNVSPFSMGDDDVWLIPFFYDAEGLSDTISVKLRIAQNVADINTNYRETVFLGKMVRNGWQVLIVKHVEQFVPATTYGTVGTITSFPQKWVQVGNMTPDKSIGAIQLVVSGITNYTAVNIASIYTAPSGWSKSVIMLGADDIPKNFQDFAIPLIESYGWRCTLNTTVKYTSNLGNYTSMNDIRRNIEVGHEIWGHGYTHFRFGTLPNVADKADYYRQKKKQLTMAKEYWNAHGIPSAAHFMAFPFGSYDEETILLLKEFGYKLARSTVGGFHQSWLPGISRFTLPGTTTDTANSWHVDTNINGCIKRGQSMFLYGHNAVLGGTGVDTYPEATSFYVDHLRRWCDLIKANELAGKVVVTTPTDYFKRCGLDIFNNTFVE